MPAVILTFAAILLAAAAARGKWRWAGWWERPLARLARHKKLAILAAAGAPLVLRALLLPLYPAPQPRVHDEFSFLLGADTLAHGRLANPPHPMAVHFESPHILVRPSYASAFPLGQAAALALGKVVLGHFWGGVWLSTGLMCGALCWMLQGWLPPRWALLGAALAIARIGVSSYWMNSYWGGSVAALGGALVLGALPRMRRGGRPSFVVGQTLIMAAGLAILANTRSFEGLVFSLAIAAALFCWMLGKGGPPRSVALRRIVVPMILSMALLGAGMAYSFARVTGEPWLPPYVLYRDTTTLAPHFLWQKPSLQPLYDNQEMRNFYVRWEMSEYLMARASLVADQARKIAVYWHFYLGPLLTIPLLALPRLWRNLKYRQLLWLAAAFWLALAAQVWHNPHYAAPATGLAILIVIAAMRYLRLWRWRGSPAGLYLVRWLPVACAAMLLVQMAAGRVADESTVQAGWRWPPPAGMKRARVLRELEGLGGKHLVLVRYAPSHHPGDEWVFNGADIDGQAVVWARELDRESNARLLAYFGERRAWLVEPDWPIPRPQPYGAAPERPMLFVQLGAPGIAVLHSPAEVRRKVEATLARHDHAPLLTCDVWNFYFTMATGVWGADVANGCYRDSNREQLVSFQYWFDWLQRQR